MAVITRYHAELALLPPADPTAAVADAGPVSADVLIEITNGRFTAVTPGVPAGVAAADGAIRGYPD